MYGCTIDVRRDILLSVVGVIVNKNVDLRMSDCKEKLSVIIYMAMPRNCSHSCCSIRNIVMPFEGVMGYVYCDGGLTCSLA